MYKIEHVRINKFWKRFNSECDFNPNVNIIIGRNGTGKTTFMNVLHSVLSVDVESICNTDFESATITLRSGKSKKTIQVKKIEQDLTPFVVLEYQITRKKYYVQLISSNDRRIAAHYRRKAIEESEDVRNELAKIVSLSSLSVYRLRSGDDLDYQDRQSTISISPVDYRLNQLLQQLTRFQLELSQKAREIATELQKEVLASILYSKDNTYNRYSINDFDKDKEKNNLISAYNQLNAMDIKIRRKINLHVDSIDKTISEIKKSTKDNITNIDFGALEALNKTKQIIKMSLEAENKTALVYEPVNLFVNILSEFITDKKFSFNGGQLEVKNNYDSIDYVALSSGEKQLLILLIETLLQKSQPYIFLTDEPELSLHIAWQRQIIPAIMRLNPNAQVIAATHSPEVASRYRDSILNMENIVHA
ncbi:AAA family ATPase [Aeromonas veronii]|uniref:AAA family ATPase n=1 Tax=Aeromonas veronii TaxID=654 RepID=UPI003BA13BF2